MIMAFLFVYFARVKQSIYIMNLAPVNAVHDIEGVFFVAFTYQFARFV